MTGEARLAGLAVLAVLTAMVCAASASAASGYRYWTSFGGVLLGREVSAVAVDSSNGSSEHDVYVSDLENSRVIKFGSDGEFILMFGDEVDATTGGDVCTEASGHQCKPGNASLWEIPDGEPAPGFSRVSELAVSPATGSSAGDVYVLDAPHDRVLRYHSDGRRVTSWADEGELQLHWVTAIAVDSAGRLLVAEGGEPATVRAFDENASELESMPIASEFSPLGLEVDRDSHLYVAAKWGEISELSAGGVRLGGFAIDYPTHDYAVDGANGDLFVSRGQHGLLAFPGDCAIDPCTGGQPFGERHVGWAGSLSVDEADQTLYVANYGGPAGVEVAIMLPGTQIPEVTTGFADVQGEEVADLHGVIDPAGSPTVVGCRFEYVAESDFQENGFAGAGSTPCEESGPISASTAVRARVTGLVQGVGYRFRLVAETASKQIVGLDERFYTPILPEAQTGAVVSVGTESAQLSGSVISPAGRPILECNFELVAEAAFLGSGFSGASIDSCSPSPFYKDEQEVQVKADADFLAPGTAYRYRIVVINSDGSARGGIRSFATRPRELDPLGEEPPPKRPHHRHHRPLSGKVTCSKKACTRLLSGSSQARTWVSPRFPRTYGWLLELYVDGDALHHTALEKECTSTFSGHGVIARLNGCHGRIKVVYRGRQKIRVRWHVFPHCRCAEEASPARTRAGRH